MYWQMAWSNSLSKLRSKHMLWNVMTELNEHALNFSYIKYKRVLLTTVASVRKTYLLLSLATYIDCGWASKKLSRSLSRSSNVVFKGESLYSVNNMSTGKMCTGKFFFSVRQLQFSRIQYRVIYRNTYGSHLGNMFAFQCCTQLPINSLEAFLSAEGRVH